ncbi:MAG: zinc-dependent metalloprotease family protein [Acidobacteriota bacterium]
MDRAQGRRRDAGLTTFTVALAAALLAPGAGAEGPPPALFESAELAAAPRLAQGPEVRRWRPVTLDGPAADALSEGRDLELDLFDAAPVRAVHRRTVRNPSGSVSWIGSVRGNVADPVVLVSRGGITVGSIRVDDRLVMIFFAGGDKEGARVHVLVELDERASRFRHAHTSPPVRPDPGQIERAEERERRMKAGEMTADPATEHDLMVVYTPLALEEVGGSVVAMENLIDLGLTETNMSYEASGIDQRLRVVHSTLTDFDEMEFTGIDARDHLQDPDDGYMDEIHPLRDFYRADMVKLITAGGCGRAFIMNEISLAHAEFAFCRTSVICVSPRYTFAHELGHVAAGRHARPVDVEGSPLPYNFGYYDAENRFRTIMAAGDQNCPSGCPRRLAWSNPDVLDPETGAPMGVPEGDPEAADNRKALNFTAWFVANFRVSGAVIFADGFESGDLAAWSEVVQP